MATVKTKKQKKKLSFRWGSMDLPFFIILLVLITFGLVMMFSASYSWGYYEGDSFSYIRKQLVIAAVGFAAMIGISMIDYHIFRNKYVAYGIFAAAFLLLATVWKFGVTRGGATRWYYIGGTSFQPSELMKFAVIILFAFIISVNYKKMNKFMFGIVPFLFVMGVVAGLMLLQPHLSGTVIICTIGVTMMFVGGANWKQLAAVGLVGAGLLVVGVLVLMEIKGIGYFKERINGWLDPTSDVQDSTFQTYQSLLAIGSGGMFGLGLGNSRQKFRYLPESHNDFVFSIICEELGFVGALVVIILFLLFIFRGFYIASKAKDKFGMMVCTGIIVQIGLQALLNIGVVTNAIPNTGISLPFFSYGGTALLMQLCEMGIVLNISRQAQIKS